MKSNLTVSEISEELATDCYSLGQDGFLTRPDYVTKAERQINELIREAYDRGYKHGYAIGYGEGKSGYEPENNPPETEVKDET